MSSKNLSEINIFPIEDPHLKRIGIVVSEWNSEITFNLLKGAKDTLINNKIKSDNIKVWFVPGAFELIFSANQLSKHHNFDAIIVIGTIIKGETKHFTFISQAIANGIKDININSESPVIFCVLTDDNIQQSIDRSGGKFGNKGVEAAISALKMIDYNSKI